MNKSELVEKYVLFCNKQAEKMYEKLIDLQEHQKPFHLNQYSQETFCEISIQYILYLLNVSFQIEKNFNINYKKSFDKFEGLIQEVISYRLFADSYEKYGKKFVGNVAEKLRNMFLYLNSYAVTDDKNITLKCYTNNLIKTLYGYLYGNPCNDELFKETFFTEMQKVNEEALKSFAFLFSGYFKVSFECTRYRTVPFYFYYNN